MIEATLIASGISKIAGCDEAGRGPCAGPLVVAAVILVLRALVVEHIADIELAAVMLVVKSLTIEHTADIELAALMLVVRPLTVDVAV